MKKEKPTYLNLELNVADHRKNSPKASNLNKPTKVWSSLKMNAIRTVESVNKFDHKFAWKRIVRWH